MIRFYAPDILTTGSLPESDSAHCVRVLRMHSGDAVEVVDGHGNLYHCRLAEASARCATVEITGSEKLPRVWKSSVTIAVAPTKNADRIEWLVEKLVEIGVDRIVPLRCRHSERKNLNVERLRKIAVSAMKQSLKAVLPVVEDMTPFNDYMLSESAPGRFIAYCDPTIERRLLAREYQPGIDTAILIGPEGDFSHKEITGALEAGWRPVTLGDNRLRTETAALVACDTCHIISQYVNNEHN